MTIELNIGTKCRECGKIGYPEDCSGFCRGCGTPWDEDTPEEKSRKKSISDSISQFFRKKRK